MDPNSDTPITDGNAYYCCDCGTSVRPGGQRDSLVVEAHVSQAIEKEANLLRKVCDELAASCLLSQHSGSWSEPERLAQENALKSYQQLRHVQAKELKLV